MRNVFCLIAKEEGQRFNFREKGLERVGDDSSAFFTKKLTKNSD